MVKVKIKDIYTIISKANSNIMYARYFKRGTGEERHMIFRVGGSSDDSGDAIPIHRILEDVAKDILTVWDLNRKEYRRLNFRDMVSLVIDQVEYDVEA